VAHVAQATVESPLAAPLRPEVARVRTQLLSFVRQRGLDVDLPWATGHALLALGADAELADGRKVVDYLVEDWSNLEGLGSSATLRFPRSRGRVPVEPHAELMLKVFAELGVSPDHEVVSGGERVTLQALYRGALARAWVSGEQSGYASWNDTPWALSALAAWTPRDASWTAEGGRESNVDALTGAVLAKLVEATDFMKQAQASGQPLVKQRQGIFAYTCGGAHLIQGAGAAVAAGFGPPESLDVMRDQAQTLQWRYGEELRIVNEAIAGYPQMGILLQIQKLKFAGHYLETIHKLAAWGMIEPTDALRATLTSAEDALVAAFDALQASGAFEGADQVRAQNAQAYLDLVGDSAHAVHGLDLAAGAEIRF
jgi:hypothetical protein